METNFEIQKPKTEAERAFVTMALENLKELNYPAPIQWQITSHNVVFLDTAKSLKEGKQEFLHQYAFCGGFGTGKTTNTIYLGTNLMVTFKRAFPNLRVKGCVISGSKDQLDSVFWSDLEHLIDGTHASKFFGHNKKKFYLKGSESSSMEARVANKGNFHSLAGIHADIVIVILEEATAIDREVFNKVRSFFTDVKGKTKGYLFVTGNPTDRSSFLYDVMSGAIGGWKTFRIGRADMCKDGDLSQDGFTQRIIEEFGEDSDAYRIGVLGEFGQDDTDAFIPEYVIDTFRNRPFVQSFGPVYMGVDVSKGGSSDYSTIIIRSDNLVIDMYRGKVVAEDFKGIVENWIERHGPVVVAIDEVGVGDGLFSYLQHKFYGSPTQIVGVNGGRQPSERNRFGNLRTELAEHAKVWMKLYGYIPPDTPYADVLFKEMRSIRCLVNERGLYTLESKTKMEKSPDMFDAFTYSFAVGKVKCNPYNVTKHTPRRKGLM